MSSEANQEQIWGLRARDWSEIQEGMFKPLFEAVLQATGVGPGCELLDVGCASCVYCEMADRLGVHVTGLDAAEAMLDFARERVPQAVFQSGDMEQLPFADQSFDVVTGSFVFKNKARYMVVKV